MAKTKDVDGQMELIETLTPQQKGAFTKKAREYKRVVEERMTLSREEVDLKQSLRDMVHKSGLKPLDSSGVIQFSVDGVSIKMTPRDELIQVKLEDTGDGEPD